MREPTSQQIEEAKAHDARVRAVADGIEIEVGTRAGQPLHAVLSALRWDADEAMREFARVNLSDTALLMDLQARVFRFRVAFETFDLILRRGQAAEQSVHGEGTHESE